MDKTQKIWVGLVIVLVVINVFMVGYLWMAPKKTHRPEREKHRSFSSEAFFKRQLAFDDAQMSAFMTLKTAHDQQMSTYHQEVRWLNRQFHEAIVMEQQIEEQAISAQLDSMTMLIKAETVGYIRSLNNLCRPEQKERLLKMLNEMPDRQGNNGRMRKRRRDKARR